MALWFLSHTQAHLRDRQFSESAFVVEKVLLGHEFVGSRLQNHNAITRPKRFGPERHSLDFSSENFAFRDDHGRVLRGPAALYTSQSAPMTACGAALKRKSTTSETSDR